MGDRGQPASAVLSDLPCTACLWTAKCMTQLKPLEMEYPTSSFVCVPALPHHSHLQMLLRRMWVPWVTVPVCFNSLCFPDLPCWAEQKRSSQGSCCMVLCVPWPFLCWLSSVYSPAVPFFPPCFTQMLLQRTWVPWVTAPTCCSSVPSLVTSCCAPAPWCAWSTAAGAWGQTQYRRQCPWRPPCCSTVCSATSVRHSWTCCWSASSHR